MKKSKHGKASHPHLHRRRMSPTGGTAYGPPPSPASAPMAFPAAPAGGGAPFAPDAGGGAPGGAPGDMPPPAGM